MAGGMNYSLNLQIGQGAYGNVYRASEVRSGRFVALKRVGFDKCIPESIHFMAREIKILRRLDHPNIVKLEGLVLSRFSRSLYLVFEYMEHDLARLLSRPNIKFNESQIKCLMQQLFLGLDHCHSRGVIHRDIKGSNLLVDGNGVLKVADFGLATFINPRQRRPLTNHVVTLWYRPPELLLGSTDYGNTVDLWSVGCVFAEMIFGEPIFQGRTEVEQLYEIFRLCGSPSDEYWRTCKLPWAAIFKSQQPYEHRLTQTFKFLPQRNLNLLNMLLSVDPTRRGTARAALASEYFLTKPYACDPSSISNTEEDFKHHEMERRYGHEQYKNACKHEKRWESTWIVMYDYERRIGAGKAHGYGSFSGFQEMDEDQNLAAPLRGTSTATNLHIKALLQQNSQEVTFYNDVVVPLYELTETWMVGNDKDW
ncbi:hypothetical protein AMTR_s00065p00208610 [Amborella trichopoda]|uniref:[RNA-polymerase]-subunit kinase n=1 Tax=Amborella trichopoda TaxID=13333 RepID=U5CZC0_AMBTC|nr:hypothetical protein AMTR_s00065p00208610 [Amborella trichopoda]